MGSGPSAEQAVQADRQELRLGEPRGEPGVAFGPANRAGLDTHDVLASIRRRLAERRSLLGEIAELAFELARLDQHVARDRLTRAVIARRAAVAGDHDVDGAAP